MPTDVEDVQARVNQSQAAKRATLTKLRKKKRTEAERVYKIGGEEMSFLYRAIGAIEYDDLVTAYPPTLEQRSQGQPYNIHKFAPALLSKVVVEPKMSEEEWTEIWTSPDWNRGEVMSFFAECVDLCSTGLQLGPTETG